MGGVVPCGWNSPPLGDIILSRWSSPLQEEVVIPHPVEDKGDENIFGIGTLSLWEVIVVKLMCLRRQIQV